MDRKTDGRLNEQTNIVVIIVHAYEAIGGEQTDGTPTNIHACIYVNT